MSTENQIGFEFGEPSWQKQLISINVDDFVGYDQTMDEKRIVIFDFLNNNAYIATEELIDEFELSNKVVKEQFPGLVVLRQNSKDNDFIDTQDNIATHENAQRAYIAREINKNSDSVKVKQKELEKEVENVEDNTVAKRNRIRP